MSSQDGGQQLSPFRAGVGSLASISCLPLLEVQVPSGAEPGVPGGHGASDLRWEPADP